MFKFIKDVKNKRKLNKEKYGQSKLCCSTDISQLESKKGHNHEQKH